MNADRCAPSAAADRHNPGLPERAPRAHRSANAGCVPYRRFEDATDRKDAAAAALRRLASAGLVRREDHRDATRGVFARSAYVIDAARLDQSGIRRHAAQPMRSMSRSGAGIAAGHGDGQASLFDLAAAQQP
jgi:hypothetical protein